MSAIEGRENIVFDRAKLAKGRELTSRYDAKYPPPCAEAVKFKALREELQLDERQAARALGLRTKGLQDIEAGRAIPEEVGAWEKATTALREAATERDEAARKRAAAW